MCKCQVIKEMAQGLGVSQRRVAREINEEGEFRTTPQEVCNALNGTLVTPKANRILASALAICIREMAVCS